MAVRVRVQISGVRRSKARAIETVALANSGFESAEPDVLLPVHVAERLGFWPPARGARAESFESPAATFSMVTVRRAVRVSTGGTRGPDVVCHAAISERETEVVLNDRAIGALPIALIDAGKGLYRISRSRKLRRSERPEHW